MNEADVINSFGLMAGTSLDGIDIAWVETDGKDYTMLKGFLFVEYHPITVESIRKSFNKHEADDITNAAEKLVDRDHIAAIQKSISHFGVTPDVIGYHGQTISHDPAKRFTWQIGNSQRVASEVNIPVVGDMRVADVKAGGQGAPLLPLCHRAFAQAVQKPIVILNLGGVGNITWLGKDHKDILAFDTGPANALIDDLVKEKTDKDYDDGGQLASTGKVHQDMVDDWLTHEYFAKLPPKSLDRNAWPVARAYDLSVEDAVATLSAFTVQSVIKSMQHLPDMPEAIYVCGGGRHNNFIMRELGDRLACPVKPVETPELDWNGDAVEAKGFAYLAVRSMKGFSLTLPTTTGVPEPMTGGKLYNPFEGASLNGALRPAITR